jgi:predicted GNAT family acetyltransferase
MPADDAVMADHPDRRRYELELDGKLVGFLTYRVDADTGVITHRHTEIEPAYEGRGLGSRLVRFALDDARARGLTVRPQCPFVEAFIGRHPQYADLMAR